VKGDLATQRAAGLSVPHTFLGQATQTASPPLVPVKAASTALTLLGGYLDQPPRRCCHDWGRPCYMGDLRKKASGGLGCRREAH